jgi:hypothetical protein
MSKEKETYKCLHMSFVKGKKSTTKSNFPWLKLLIISSFLGGFWTV